MPPPRTAATSLLDREEPFEADVLDEGHDVPEAGAREQVEIALRGERFEHTLEAALLAEDFLLVEAVPQLELVIQLRRQVLEAGVGRADFLEQEERAAPLERPV